MIGITTGAGYCLNAIGLTMVFGILNIVNLAHGEFYMVGAFLTLLIMTSLGIHYLVAVPLAVLGTGLLALICSKTFINPMRDRPWTVILLALFGLSFILQDGAALLFGTRPRLIPSPYADNVFRLGYFHMAYQQMLVIVAVLGVAVGLRWAIRSTRFGKALRATAQNKVGAALVGVNMESVYTRTFFAGCALAGAAGAITGPLVYVDHVMGALVLFKALIIIVCAGMGNITGAIIVGLLLGIAESFTAVFFAMAWMDIGAYATIIAILLIRPTGLFGTKVR
jgi:branched-chain amino acid transport system permease protein